METSVTAEAIKEVERLARQAAGPQTVVIEVPDGAGKTTPIPILVNNGVVAPLQDAIRIAAKLARDLRANGAAAPGWREGTAEHQSLQSFINHVQRFKSPASAVWADPSSRRLVSVLDYHPVGAESQAAWGRHRGVYASPLSEAWLAWGGEKGLSLTQEDFADLLDSRDYELAAGMLPSSEKEAPTPASLITMANKLEVYSTATAKRERDPKTGRVQISYSEDKGVSGDVHPPPAFAIRIRIFQDSEPELIEVRLRVAVDAGHATFNLNIHAAGELLRAAFYGLCEKVRTGGDIPVFEGTPERVP